VPVLVNAAVSSRKAMACSTAVRCAARTAAWVVSSDTAHRVETDFVGVNVRSNPATAVGVRLASSTRVIVAIAVSRASAAMSCGSAATCLAMRSAAGVW